MCNLKCKCLKNDSSMQVELKSRVCSVESCLDSNCGVYSTVQSVERTVVSNTV